MAQRVVIPGFRKIETSNGGGGVTDYEELKNKPSLNDKILSGNKSNEYYGILGTKDSLQENLVVFESKDSNTPDPVLPDVIKNTDSISLLMQKISNIAKNVRYAINMIGTNELISGTNQNLIDSVNELSTNQEAMIHNSGDAVDTGSILAVRYYKTVTLYGKISSTKALTTSARYVLLGQLPAKMIPNQVIICYLIYNYNTFGQLRISTTGTVEIGYTKGFDGSPKDLPAGSALYFCQSYVI